MTPADELDQLREENRQLRALLVDAQPTPKEWGLTRQEQWVYRCLAARAVATRDQIYQAASAGKVQDEQIVNVLVYRIRRKLKPHGIGITNHWGVGYSLERPAHD